MELIGYNFLHFIWKFSSCHNVLTILLLGLLLIRNNKTTPESKNWLYTINTLLPFFLSVCFFSSLYLIFVALQKWEPEPTDHVSAYASAAFAKIALQQIGTTIPGLLFMFKKLRLSIVLIIVNLIAQNFFAIKNIILYSGRDYLTSSWQLQEETFIELLTRWIAPLVVIVLMYLFLRFRKKLPYPSAFIKSNAQPL